MESTTQTPTSQEADDLLRRITELEQRLTEKDQEADALRRIGQAIGLMFDMQHMLQMVAEIIAQVTGTDLCLIYLLDETRSELILRAASKMAEDAVGNIRMKVGEGVTGWVAQTRERVALDKDAPHDKRFKLIPDLKQDEFNSMLSVPLLAQEKVIGVINVRTNRAHVYTDSQIELMESIAGQVAGAIQNSLQFHQVQRRASQLSTLSEISRTISSSLYLEEILQFIVAVTADSMNLSICSLMMIDEETSELVIKATTSQSKAYIKKPNIRLGESLAGKAVTEGRPVSVLDVRKTVEYRHTDIARQEGLVSLICVPMIIKGKIIGVLNCYTAKPHHFTDEEVQLLSALASHAAIAIENSQLHVRSAILQEMHHRVKNNLQTVASLLRLQIRYARQVSTESALTESINRIQAISVVHDMLSREDLDTVSVRKLAETILVAHLSGSLPTKHGVEAKVDGPDMLLASHQATSVALVLNELMQNAIEHGLMPDLTGTLRVVIEAKDDDIVINVENTGNTLPAEFNFREKRNLGLQIVENLVRDELHGTFELTGGEVSKGTIRFSR